MWIGLLTIIAVGIIGGTSPILLKFAVKEFPPLLTTSIRFLIAIIILLPFFLQKTNKNLGFKDIKGIAATSLFFAFNVGLFSIAIQYTTAIISQIFYLIVPIVVIVLSFYMLGEKFTRYKIIGLIFAFSGTLFLVRQSIVGQDSLTFGTPLGNILALCASLSWALYLVLSKKLTKKYSPIVTSFVSYVITFLLLIALVPFEHVVRPVVFEKITPTGLFSVLTLGIINTGLFFFLFQFAINKTTPFMTSSSSYLGVFVAAVLAIPLFGEKVTLELVMGGILLMVGVFFATTYEQLKKK